MRIPCVLHVGGENNKLYSLRRWKNGLGYNSRKVENAWEDVDKPWTLTTAGRWWVRETLRPGSTGDTLHLGTGGSDGRRM